MLKNITFVTGNPDKLREASEILGVTLRQAAIDLEELQTINVEDLIIHKAEEAYKKLRCPIIVEDTGLVFSAWNGLPGALIKWFQKTVDNGGIVKMLESETDRRARAQCFVAFHDGHKITVVKGELSGTIANAVRGENGFGWDRIFIPDGHTRTFGEMSAIEKNSFSHRKIAFDNLKKLFEKTNALPLH